MVGVFN